MILAIVGPTGIGKTALSIALAKHFKAEIINFDALQVYEKLDIGTAKVTKEEMEGVKHHLLSYVPLEITYSVYDYQTEARKLLDQLLKEQKNIILVGGTGLYLKALLYDYEFKAGTQLNTYENLANEEILEKIKSYDQEVLPHVNNRRRLVRLLNKLENGEKIGTNGNTPLYQAQVIGLCADRQTLYERLDKRVEIMFQNGLEKEIEAVKDLFPTSHALKTGIGYKEFIPFLEGNCSLEEVKDAIKKNSRHYAKRQFTFFRNQFSTKWYEVNFSNFTKTIEEVITDIEKVL